MNSLLQQHMTPEEMTMALAGELSPERQEAFERHRSACEGCAAAYEEQIFARQTLAALGKEPAMPERLATKLHAQLTQESQMPPAEEEAASPGLVYFPAQRASDKPTATPTRQARRRFQPPRWVAAHRVASIVLAAFLAIGLMAGSVYAVRTLLDQVINSDPGTKQADLEQQFVPVKQSQTIGGFTVTVEKAYADANRVVIAVTVKKPAGHIYNSAFPDFTLTINQGVKLPQNSGSGYGNRNGDDAYVDSYDGAAITGNPKTLSLHLELNAIYVAQQDGDNSTFRSYTVAGSASFDFSVPFHAGRVASLHQSSTVGGSTLTLERVVVSLSETRVYLQVGMPDQQQSQDGKGSMPLITHLSVGGWDSDHSQGAISEWRTPDGLTEISYGVSLFDQHGPWTLTVQASSDGPSWTFHFIVP
jgi:hypothetical protein